ncbi:MAG: asparagine--tRNA ligase, partial [Clostridia bacterium]|nr:asparagine--tRNA ligase [Clostridia bacterium]
MIHTDIKAVIGKPEEYFDKKVTVCGWIKSFRDSKNMAFIALNDGTTLNHLQVVID